jgi:short-subunit dehydrogenase
MSASAFDLDTALQHLQVNQVGALHLLDATLPHLLHQRAGHLSLVGNVAGYRGLPHSLACGPTTAALINLAEALYLDLRPLGIGVSLVCPGNGHTPQKAARAIVHGRERGDLEIHFPRRFTLWLKGLRHLPYRACFAAVGRSTGL